jgi:hypothetical protein
MSECPEYRRIEFVVQNPQNVSYKALVKDLERLVGMTTCSLFPLLSFIEAMYKMSGEEI